MRDDVIAIAAISLVLIVVPLFLILDAFYEITRFVVKNLSPHNNLQ